MGAASQHRTGEGRIAVTVAATIAATTAASQMAARGHTHRKYGNGMPMRSGNLVATRVAERTAIPSTPNRLVSAGASVRACHSAPPVAAAMIASPATITAVVGSSLTSTGSAQPPRNHIGGTTDAMKRNGFEVHDTEGRREHYGRTCRLWTERLHANREAAYREAGEAKTKIWLLYLAGCALAFERGTVGIFQTVASRRTRGPAGLPPTRAGLYEGL